MSTKYRRENGPKLKELSLEKKEEEKAKSFNLKTEEMKLIDFESL